ncbi:MAG: hypothetical protein DRQ47_05505 [Gammaproteobacteria bacterium]|nr:MAG: hypothetical protein DRQ47_05505 [Gammaproteobacteria bacterium]
MGAASMVKCEKIRCTKFYWLIIFFLIGLTVQAQQSSVFTTSSSIHVIGDVHGAYNEIQKTLTNLGLIDQQNNWSGGTSHFVCLGNIMDKGAATKKVMDLFIKLQTQAEQAGGQFHVILGEHEVMNLKGDRHGLSAEEIAEFSEDETTEQRQKAYQQYIQWHKLTQSEQTQTDFDTKYPVGFFAHQQAFGLSGKYGKWLLELPFIIKINDQLFTHGGLSQNIKLTDLTSLNKQLKSELLSYLKHWDYFLKKGQLGFDIPFEERAAYLKKLIDSPQKRTFMKNNRSLVLSTDGPSSYQGNSQCHPYFEEDQLAEKLQFWEASRLWVGNTSLEHGPSELSTQKSFAQQIVQQRLSEQLMMMNTELSSSKHQTQLWTATITPDGQTNFSNGSLTKQFQPEQAVKRHSRNVYNMSDEEIEQFMKTAEITNMIDTTEGKTKPFKVTMEKDGKVIHGIFKYMDTHPRSNRGRWRNSVNQADRYQYELAAYRLDRLLGIGLVPVTVARNIDGRDGIIQFWVDGLISLLQYNDDKIIYKGICDFNNQVNFLDSFDYLILNTDRNQSNVMFNKNDGQIWFIDHSKSFGTSSRRPKMLKKSNIKVTKAFRTALKNLTSEQLQELSPWLHKKQIQAIMNRRDYLVSGNF